MATYKEALESSVEYFNGDELAASTYVGKYALTTPEGDILEPTPDLMHKRLAKEFARIEAKYPNPMSEEEIFNLFDKFSCIIPQGSPMSGVGNPYQIQSLGNCFVLPEPSDSYSGICLADQQLVQLSKRRAGVGISLNKLRPANTPTKNSSKISTGIGPYMERYSNSIREVGQGNRRGALLLSVSIHHPDIETFITIKKDKTKVTGANVTVQLSKEFLNALENNTEYEQRWPVDSKTPSITRKVSAQKIWDMIIESNWEGGEPGLSLFDNVLMNSPANCYQVINKDWLEITSNPCGEIIMGPDSCRLLLLNLCGFLKNPFLSNAAFDWESYKEKSQVAQRLMDDLIDLELESIDKILEKIESDPEPEEEKYIERAMWHRYRKNCLEGRRTGTGITGLGDVIAALGIQYGSKESIEFTEEIYKQLEINCYKESAILAKERGPFPIFSHEIDKNSSYLQRVVNSDEDLKKLYEKHGRRNIATTTTAPAGSVSILACLSVENRIFGTTSGIEPAYLLWYTRRKKINPNTVNARVDFVDGVGDKWQEYKIYHQGFQLWKKLTGLSDEDVEKSPYWKATSNDVDWVASVDLQAAAQKWVSHSISKTINIPNSATKEDVAKIYLRAAKSGLKGCTVYRDGSRSGVLVSTTEKKKEAFTQHDAPKRPKELECNVYQSTVQGEKWSIFVGLLDGKPYEIMGGLSKYVKIPRRVTSGKLVKNNGEINPARYDFHYDFEKGPEEEAIIQDIGNVFENPTHSGFTRVLSLALRHGTPVQYATEQLVKAGDKDSDLFSISKAFSRVLKNYVKDGTKVTVTKKCLVCGSKDLAYKDGCAQCLGCGDSKCG